MPEDRWGRGLGGGYFEAGAAGELADDEAEEAPAEEEPEEAALEVEALLSPPAGLAEVVEWDELECPELDSSLTPLRYP